MPKLSANLDFLRSVAVLLVLSQHLTRRFIGDSATSSVPTTFLGLFGVLIFFVHTSLVLMYSMERTGLSGRALLRDFYIRRAFRIYPLSILAVAAALILHLDSNINGIAGLSRGQLPGVKVIVAHFLLVQNLIHAKSIVNVLWSLPFEVQMYLFLPFLFAWVWRKRSVWPLLGLWVVSMVGAWVQPHFGLLSRFSLLLYVPCFLPGIMAYVLPHVPRVRWFLWPIFIFGLIGVYVVRPGDWTGRVLCLALGLAIPFFQEIQSPVLRTVSNRIATYSYGIYLSHQFCIWFALGVLGGSPLWLRVAVLVASLVVLPVALYHAVEKPMIGVGVRVAAREQRRLRFRPPWRRRTCW